MLFIVFFMPGALHVPRLDVVIDHAGGQKRRILALLLQFEHATEIVDQLIHIQLKIRQTLPCRQVKIAVFLRPFRKLILLQILTHYLRSSLTVYCETQSNCFCI